MSTGTSLLRLVTTGSVDDGKSTLIGRMLYETRSIPEDQYAAIKSTSSKRGDDEVDLSLLLDGLAAEREQAITIDVAYRYFSTPKRKFIIADCPGHEQYTRNMVTGASTADAAVILIDARNGVITQSKRHGFLISLLRLQHLVVAVNKMDLVDYSEEVFNRVVGEYSDFSEKLDIQDVAFIPVSARCGDNVVSPSERMPWYHGRPLLEHLENMHVSADRNRIDFRFPVQNVIRPDSSFRGYGGKVLSGSICPGEKVAVLPSLLESTVRSLVTYDGKPQKAEAGDAVVIQLADEIDVSRGDMIVRQNNIPTVSEHFEAMVCWMDEQPMKRRYRYILKHTTRQVNCYIADVVYAVDVNTLHRERTGQLSMNQIGRVELHTTLPLYFDPYRINRETGSAILIDPHTNNTVGACMITGLPKKASSLPKGATARRKVSEHTTTVAMSVSADDRMTRNGHRPACIWLTGYSGAGKSAIACRLENVLFEHFRAQTMVLDGDNLRHGLCGDLGFTQNDRTENIRRAGEVAKLFYDNGSLVTAAFIAPARKQRGFVREIFGGCGFYETYVKCSLEECMRRDPKGLYKKALDGEIEGFTGVDSVYEEPDNPELIIETEHCSVDGAVTMIINRLQADGILPAACSRKKSLM